MSRIKIEVDASKVQAKIRELQASGASLDGPLGAIGRTIKTRVELGFKTSTSPHGIPWAPLKSRKGKPLIDTGRLKNSITWQIGSDQNSKYVDVGTNVKYGAIHQFGLTRNVPARLITVHRKIKKNGDFANNGKFVKKNKSNFASQHNSPAHQITIPARPFLPLNQAGDIDLPQPWKDAIIRSLKSHFSSRNKG